MGSVDTVIAALVYQGTLVASYGLERPAALDPK